MNNLKICIAQLNFTVGDLANNAKKIIQTIQLAYKKKSDIVIFPEMAITGYPPQDLIFKNHFIEDNLQILAKIAKSTPEILCIVGFIDKDKENNLYNAAALIFKGRIIDIYRKIQLPNYGVFDEKRYFSSGQYISSYQWKGYTFSITICEDIWVTKHIEQLKNYKFDFLINISASPFQVGKINQRAEILSSIANNLKTPVVYCNLIGGQDDLVFDGTSMVISSQGQILKIAKRFQEDNLYIKIPINNKPQNKYSFSPDVEEIYQALCLGIKDYVEKNNFKKVIIGVSGGIDSAVVICLAAAALGKKNVHGLIMPSQFTSKFTYRDAKKLCNNLGVSFSEVNITNIYRSYLEEFKKIFPNKRNDVTEENIQARIRGNLLMSFSNKLGYLVLNTGNKSELSCGYCTLYGDMVGGFGVLSDVYKTSVYKLAKYINKKNNNVIPRSIILRPPSAELKENQKDSDFLPDYYLLDKILKLYIEENKSLDEIVKEGFGRKLVARIITMVDKNEYKRRQAPFGIKISPRAFGRERRMPITNKYIG